MKTQVGICILFTVLVGVRAHAGEAVHNGGFEKTLLPGHILHAQSFDQSSSVTPFRSSYGDPAEVTLNAIDHANDNPCAHLRFRFTDSGKSMTYWSWDLKSPQPITPQLARITARIKCNVPVHLKIGIPTYGFIYHGPAAPGDGKWHTVTVTDAYETLKAWCAGGNKPVVGAHVGSVIFSTIHTKGKDDVELFVDDIRFETDVASPWPIGWRGSARLAQDSAQAVAGRNAVALGPGTGALSTTLRRIGNGYISTWAKGDGTLRITLSDTDTKLRSADFPVTSGWQEYTLPLRKIRTAAINPELSFSLVGEEGEATLDEVSAFIAEETVRVSVAALVWDEGCRTLVNALHAVDEAAAQAADLICLPEICVDSEPQVIASSVSDNGLLVRALSERAKRSDANLVANPREADGGKTYHTSILFGRDGAIIGSYRKSHRLPGETMDLGDTLPIFQTDIGPIGMLVGTDIYFSEAHERLRKLGAKLIVWSTTPFAKRDEFPLDNLLRGRALELRTPIAVSRYAGKRGYGGYEDRFSWMATWPLGRAMVIDRLGHTVADTTHMAGVATAIIPARELAGRVRKRGSTEPTTPKVFPPVKPLETKKRTVRVSIVESTWDFERLLARLDICGQRNTDIVGLGEYVWYRTQDEVVTYRERNEKRLAALAAKAGEHKMYMVVSGELIHGFNDGYFFDRQGQQAGYYIKILQTTDRSWKTYREGKETPVFETDFGRIAMKICNDTNGPFIDFEYGMKGAELVFFPTMDAGPYDEWREFRHRRRCVDNGFWMVSTNYPGHAQAGNRSFIMDPWGYTVLGSACMSVTSAKRGKALTDDASILTLDIDLDARPVWHASPQEPPVLDLSKGGLLRILPREPNVQIDTLCLTCAPGAPDDAQCATTGGLRRVFLKASDFAQDLSKPGAKDAPERFEVREEPAAIAKACVVTSVDGRTQDPKAYLTYRIPSLSASRAWTLWARAQFPDVNSDSFFWQISPDNGKTWSPPTPDDQHAIGWQQGPDYQWVSSRNANAKPKAPLMGDLRTLIHQNRRPELYSAGW
ncbi:MAG: carbon-nitrogen hydrolase family protein [Lentisphaerae bacterium]|nr:carbon-nitrogen hydrolase family protein [Lentisphaerota bacterium]MBT4820861.1 carbon-nitrogen hydrolase family protein [Lentisphaerota bacterium]MBT5607299.1 carbon-nitrogen hydrolase family protein [Lentisphaerota bacterium]MBT7055383.1 carbon-nitrogen hydrolase family protein [Lentisphaerota bacterium]MBT7840981.1 carbon-nitrogen hydrolase family protein [Lentisphaerota bacterium]